MLVQRERDYHLRSVAMARVDGDGASSIMHRPCHQTQSSLSKAAGALVVKAHHCP